MSYKQLVLGASGIYFSYLTLSVVSERMYSIEYPSLTNPDLKHKFAFPCLTVWFSSLLCALFGMARAAVNKEASNPISRKEQMLLGLLYTVNILCTYYSLLYISFPVQIVGRNCRYLTCVIVGVFFSRVKSGSALKLGSTKILTAVIVTVSVIIFTLGKDSGHQKSSIDTSVEWKGYVLVLISVIADALFSDSQAYSKSQFKPTQNHLFVSANFYTFLFVLVFSLARGQLFEQLAFCLDHPSALLDLLVVSVLQVFGQVTIYYVIANFRQHVFPLISTTRKVFTILLSLIIFKHHITMVQQLSVVMLFMGLSYELYKEVQAKKDTPHSHTEKDKSN